jgi:hypothetical protein
VVKVLGVRRKSQRLKYQKVKEIQKGQRGKFQRRLRRAVAGALAFALFFAGSLPFWSFDLLEFPAEFAALFSSRDWTLDWRP